MPFRPSSAPTRQGSALARKRPSELATPSSTASRVQFREGLADTGPDLALRRPPHLRPRSPARPKDPIPDSDEEDKTLLLTPRSAAQLAGVSPSSRDPGESKWWHIPDTRIEEIVQTIEDDASTCPVSPKLLKSSSRPSAPSSTCRALINAGQRQPKKTAPLNAAPSEMSGSVNSPQGFCIATQDAATGHFDVDTYAVSSTMLRDIRVRDSVAKGMTWPLQERRAKFDHITTPKRGWTEAELFLSSTKSLEDVGRPIVGRQMLGNLLGESSSVTNVDRPSTAPEPARLSSHNAKRALRPSSGCIATRSRSFKEHGRVSCGKVPSRSSSFSGTSRSDAAKDSERELIQVELAFYDNADRICILISPEARVGLDQASGLPDKMTLKGMITKLTGIAAGDQRLLCKGFDVSDDQASLRKAGISHESIVMVYHRGEMSKKGADVVLACTAKKKDKEQKQKQQDSRRAVCLQDSRRQKKVKNQTALMPKWGWGIPPDNTLHGRGYNDIGAASSFKFENNHIWYDEIDFRLSDIRQSQTYTKPIEYAAPGVAPHCE